MRTSPSRKRTEIIWSMHDRAVALGAHCPPNCPLRRPLAKASPDDPVHPGYPAGAPDSRGGQFRPKKEGYDSITSSQLPPDSQASPVPATDDNGDPIIGALGDPLRRPAHLDPQMFVCAGRSAGVVLSALDLPKFKQGGPWDAQRVGNCFVDDYRDYATISIGLYMAAAGIPIEVSLGIQDSYAQEFSKYHEPMDSVYTHLPVRNVKNTQIGYDLFTSGRVTCAS